MSTVLVVEDSPAARDVVTKILRREGYDVVSATNGYEALDALRHSTPDVMLLDVMMPEMDGMTVLSHLRDDPEHKDLPVILLTALSDDTRMQQARDLGVSDYLVKSRFSYDDLVYRVGKYARH